VSGAPPLPSPWGAVPKAATAPLWGLYGAENVGAGLTLTGIVVCLLVIAGFALAWWWEP